MIITVRLHHCHQPLAFCSLVRRDCPESFPYDGLKFIFSEKKNQRKHTDIFCKLKCGLPLNNHNADKIQISKLVSTDLRSFEWFLKEMNNL